MKAKRSLRGTLALLLTLVMLFSVMTPMMSFTATALTVDTSNIGSNTKLTSKTDYAVAPGITESHIITHNKDGSNQVQSFAVEIDLSNPNVGILASYKDYMNNLASTPTWGFQTVRDQAAAAENYYRQTDSNFDVVAGINGDYFNMQVGNPTGSFVMNGTVYNENNGWNYFAILDDGTPVIGSGAIPENAEQLVGGPSILVKDGKIVADPNNPDMFPRTSVGITAEGKVIFITADGRQAPYSCGQTIYENAQQMLSLGCVDAIQLDGGGSATIVSQREGEEGLSVRNSPSDGQERTVSTALLVYSTAAPDGQFDHANLAPNNELYTTGSTITFTATGVDGSGSAVALPENGEFALADAAAGTIDAKTGVFTAAEGYTGDVTVNYVVDGKVKGSTTVSVVVPDELYISSTEQAVGPGVTTDFGIVAKYEDRDVVMKDSDIIWTITDQTSGADLNGVAGTFSGLNFTSAEDNAYNAKITATLASNSELVLDLTVFIGSKQVSLYDFEYVTGEENKDAENYISSFTLPTYSATWLNNNSESNASVSAVMHENDIPLYMWPNASLVDVNNTTTTATVVSAADGEPTRFGDKALKIHFDYSSYNFQKNANFYLRMTDPDYAFEGSPTAIGCWVYAPEGTTNYILYLNCANECDDPVDGFNTSYQPLGKIDWVGWKYLEFDLTGTKTDEEGNSLGGQKVGGSYEPFGFYQGCGVFWISYQPANMGHASEDTIYIDDITLIYGANTSDTINPEITHIGGLTEELVDGETVYTSNVNTFKAQYADVEDKYMTGIDDAATKMYIDGVDVTDKCYINEGDDEIYFYDAYLANGTHCIEIEVADVFGNKTTEVRYFTVAASDSNTEFDFVEVDGSPVLGEKYSMAIVTNNIADVQAVEMEVKVLSNYTRYWNDFEIKAAAGFELVGEPVFNETLSTIKFKVEKSDENAPVQQDLENAIVYVNVNIPTDVPEGLEATYRVSKGSVTYASDKAEKYATGFSGKIVTTCISPFNVAIDTMIVGSTGGYMTVTDTDGNLVEGVNIYYGDTVLGTTDANGQIFTDAFIQNAVTFTVYAEKEGQLSFEYTTQSYNAGGNEDGTPSNIKLNASENPVSSQNISWMASPLTSTADAVVYYAEKADYDANGENTTFQEFRGESYLSQASASGNIETNYAVRLNSAVITGLKADTEYVYKVGDGVIMSTLKSFKTSSAGTDTSFFVLGDTQSSDTTNVTAIFNELAASGKEFDFAIQTGDAVDNAGDYSYWNGIGSVFSGDFIGEIDTIHALGNHEFTGDGKGINASKYFNLPGTTDEAPLAYSFEYGNVYVAVLSYLSSSDIEEAAEWLVEDASNSTANWKVLAMHQPTYFTNVGGGSTRAGMDILAAAIDEADIDVAFSGHDHSYARTYPITGGVQADGGTVYYICAATSAEKGYQVTSDPAIHEIATDEYNSIYLTIDTTDTTFAVTTWNYNGTTHEVFDSYTITKEITCTEDGTHNYLYSDDKLTCSVCGYTMADTGYNGVVTDAETGLPIMLENGELAASKWVEMLGGVYYLGEDGIPYTGAQKVGEYDYEFATDGKLTKYAFVNDGKLVTNTWIGQQYYLGADGLPVTGEQTIKCTSEKWGTTNLTYTFDEDGNFVKGALVKEGKYYYYYIAGEKQRGWNMIDGYWHYFDVRGVAQSGIPSFAMATGDHKVSRADSSLELVFKFDSQGRLVKGAWDTMENGTVYYWGNNERLTGWQYLDSNIYYFGADTYMVTGTQTIDGAEYNFGEDGKLQLKEANFALDGLYYYYNSYGLIDTAHIEDHPYVKVIDEAVAPTETESGLTAGEHCDTCGFETIPQVTVPALNNTTDPDDTTKPVDPDDTTKPVDPDDTTKPVDPDDTTTPVVPYIVGDLDRDGKITANDARLSLRIAAKIDPVTDTKIYVIGDVNFDGELTAADARKILRVSAKIDKI